MGAVTGIFPVSARQDVVHPQYVGHQPVERVRDLVLGHVVEEVRDVTRYLDSILGDQPRTILEHIRYREVQRGHPSRPVDEVQPDEQVTESLV
jgi:hypothetical protein